jgi:hypothetical protein
MLQNLSWKVLIVPVLLGCSACLWCNASAGAGPAADGARIVDLPCPNDLKENPSLIQDLPFGVLLGTVRAADTGKPVPNALVVLVTKGLVQGGERPMLDREMMSRGDYYLSETVSDAKGEFSFYYVPPRYLSGELSMIVYAAGYKPTIQETMYMTKGAALAADLQLVRSQ